MAKNVTLLGANYPDVPAVQLPQTGGGTVQFIDADDIPISAFDENKWTFSASGQKILTITKNCWVNVKCNTGNTAGNLSAFLMIDGKYVATAEIYSAGQYANCCTAPVYVKAGTSITAYVSFPTGGGGVVQIFK